MLFGALLGDPIEFLKCPVIINVQPVTFQSRYQAAGHPSYNGADKTTQIIAQSEDELRLAIIENYANDISKITLI